MIVVIVLVVVVVIDSLDRNPRFCTRCPPKGPSVSQLSGCVAGLFVIVVDTCKGFLRLLAPVSLLVLFG